MWPTHHLWDILCVWQEHISRPGKRFQASPMPLHTALEVDTPVLWHLTCPERWSNSISQSGEKLHSTFIHVDMIPTAVHTSGFPTKGLCHDKWRSAKSRTRWAWGNVENVSTVCDIRCGPGGAELSVLKPSWGRQVSRLLVYFCPPKR